ncbi:MAG: hypothetical protein JRI23_30050 [Deltaproteobacteria bacterium]|jgi:hypothetical protein|nr:hypothetical protein [Deltaproteobacteria bacterium]MBW2536394.1 hypothetical protein [Deltaproteobacteria bacterium]
MRRVVCWGTGTVVYAVIAATSCGDPFVTDETTSTGAGSVTTTTPAGTASGTTPTAIGGAGTGGTGSTTTGSGGTGNTTTGSGGGTTTTTPTNTGTDIGGSGPTSFCEQRFGMLTNYDLCHESGAYCEFEAKLWGRTCRQVCNDAGVDCDGGYEPDPVGSCFTGNSIGCNLARTTPTICECTKTCSGAGGVACGPDEVCSSTGCQTTN